MYDYGYGYDYEPVVNTGGILAGAGFIWFLSLAISVFVIVCMWKLYAKAGKPGWASLVPIYNIIVLLEIVELPMWYIALFLVPFANIYAMFKIYIELAHKFGKSTGFGVAMVFFSVICLPMLAFGNAQYNGSSTVAFNNNAYAQTNNNYQQPMANTNVNVVPNSNESVMDNGLNNQQTFLNTNVNTVPTQNATVMNNQQSVMDGIKKTCPNCGNQVDVNAAFCTNCGKNMQ